MSNTESAGPEPNPLVRAREYLQQGRADEALALLQSAVAADSRSAEAYELLGVAYAQRGMIQEGIQALSNAVNLNPGNPASRINLGVALQRAGRTQEAAAQLNEALRLDPANEKARRALAEVQGGGSQPAAPPPPYGAPAQPPYGTPGYGQPGYGAPGGGAPGYGPPGAPGYGQPGYSPPGYGSPYQHGAVPPPPGYGYPGYGAPMPADPMGWSPHQIFSVLTRPVEFFQRQQGVKELGQPIGFVLSTAAIQAVIQIVAGGSRLSGAQGSAAGMGAGLVIGVPIGLAFLLLGVFMVAGIFHLCAMMFGQRGGFPGTFRAVVYSWSPCIVFGILASLIVAAAPGTYQLAQFLQLAAGIWAFVLLVIAFREIHGLSTGSAFGAAFIGAAIQIALVVLLVFTVAAGIMAALMSTQGRNPNSNPFGGGNNPFGNQGSFQRSFPGAGGGTQVFELPSGRWTLKGR